MANSLNRVVLALLFALGLSGLARAQEPEVEPKAENGKKVALPWTAEEIKKAWKKGCTTKYKVVIKSARSEISEIRLHETTDVSDECYTVKTTYPDEDAPDAPVPASSEEVRWDHFERKMNYTDKNTTVRDEKVKVGAGEFECKVYTLTSSKDGNPTSHACYYIKDKPGHYAKIVYEQGHKDARETFVHELLELKPEPEAIAKTLDLPWTVAEFKKAWKQGTKTKFKVVKKSVDGEEVAFLIREVTSVYDDGYSVESTTCDKNGKAIPESVEDYGQSWDACGSPRTFTDKDTKISHEKTKVAAGEFECVVYTQSRSKNGDSSTTVLYFIKSKPGHYAKLTIDAESKGKKLSSVYELVELNEG